ncbi:hypothetical protein BR93DRAFT_124246 [Coniochaeta sp. PMI_546]|nr:hypothetical protein BR93DRAFT_124246 [Coniochaeta sp. PMI_546]
MVQTRAATRAQALAQTRAQVQSPFFRLPQELLDQIYYHVFSTTELAFDERPPPPGHAGFKQRKFSRLGLLRTCRRARDDIADRWIGYVWFSFYNLWDLLRVMTAVPPDKLSKMRFLRILCPSLSYSTHRVNTSVYHCTLDAVFGILPGLRLDKLVVHGLSYHRSAQDHTDCRILQEMITRGDGWKELHYICPRSLILACHDYPWWREGSVPPQPEQWHHILRDRDGEDSDASVTIYRSDPKGDALSQQVQPAFKRRRRRAIRGKRRKARAGKQPRDPSARINWLDWGWAEDKDFEQPAKGRRYDWVGGSTQWCPFTGDLYRDKSVKFGQECPVGVWPQDYRTSTSLFLRLPTERWKGMHIVVKRGSGADYTAKLGSPAIAWRTPFGFEKQTWEQFRLQTPGTTRLW